MKSYFFTETPSTRVDCRLTRLDAIWLLFWLAIELSACAFLSHGRQFWSDEIFGVLLARDTFAHMLFAWRNGADGGGLFFYLIIHIWVRIFGVSTIAIRFFSAVGFWIALVCTWIAARRWYRLEIVAVSLPFCWLTAHSVLRQLMIGRFYGMLFAAVAAAVCCHTLASGRRSSAKLCLCTFAVHCLLVGSHPFGVLYSFTIILAGIVSDATSRDWRPWLYASSFAGWWILWPSRMALYASSAVSKPHFWTITPTFDDLRSAFSFWTDELQWLWFFLLVILVLLTAIPLLRSYKRRFPCDAPVRIVALALMAVIPILWFASLGATSYFVDRYLLSTIIGAALLQCAILQRVVPSPRSTRATVLLCLAVAAAFGGSIYSFFTDMPQFTEPPHAYTDTLAKLVPTDIPIAIERVDIFAEASFADPDRPWRYLLDRDIANSPDSPRGEISGYNEMQNWKRSGYFSAQILPSNDFLSNTREFFVVNDPKRIWFDRLIRNNPAYSIRRVGQVTRENSLETVWHVQRVY